MEQLKQLLNATKGITDGELTLQAGGGDSTACSALASNHGSYGYMVVD